MKSKFNIISSLNILLFDETIRKFKFQSSKQELESRWTRVLFHHSQDGKLADNFWLERVYQEESSQPGLSFFTFSNNGNLEREILFFFPTVSTDPYLHSSLRLIEHHNLGMDIWGGLAEATQRSPWEVVWS